MENVLESIGVTKNYAGKAAVDNVSLKLETGLVYAMLGPNGSGKTTWMKMVAGLVKPGKGEILYKGKAIGKESKKEIAYMSTEPYFYSWMTVADVGRYYQDFFEDFSNGKISSDAQKNGADRRAENQKTFHRYDGKVKDRSHNGKKCKTVSAG